MSILENLMRNFHLKSKDNELNHEPKDAVMKDDKKFNYNSYDNTVVNDVLDKNDNNSPNLNERKLDTSIEVLTTMSKTQTLLTLPALESILPEDVYMNLVTQITEKVAMSYPRENFPDMSSEDYRNGISEMVNESSFVVRTDAQQNMFVESRGFESTNFSHPIYVDCIDCDKFLTQVRERIEKHLNNASHFHSTSALSGAQIPSALRDAIKLIDSVIEEERRLSVVGDSVLGDTPTATNEFSKNENEMLHNNNEIEKHNFDDKNYDDNIGDDDR